MDSGRNMISSAVPFRAAGEGGGQVLLFGGGGGGGNFIRGGAAPVAVAGDGGWRKRPFQLTAREELQLQLELGDDELAGFDYELHAAGGGAQQERAKRRLTAEQVRELEVSFEEEKRKLEPERKSELARRLGIAPRQVAVWFQNRRARWKTKQLEQDFDRLRAAHDELLAGRDALLADNDRLRSQVIILTEKLEGKESPEPEPEDQTVALQAAAYARFEQDRLCTETATGGAAPAVGYYTGGASDSPESYLAGARSPPSSSEDDCGGGDGDGGAFLILPDTDPDALLAAAAEEDGAQLNNCAWLWSEQQY